MKTMTLKTKIVVVALIVFAVAVAAVLVVLYAPLPMNVDWDSIYDIESNVVLLEAGAEGNPTDAPALVKLNSDGSIDTSDWKILQFTDMHLSEKNKGALGNDRTIDEYIKAIERERPDFVALTGDIITSFRGRARAVQLCEIMEKLGVYWAYSLGNHEGDAFYKLQRQPLMDIIEKYPHCLSEGSVKKTADGTEVWGIGNFVVNLLGENKKVVQSLIFMDSGDAITDEDAKKLGVKKGSYDYLKPSQMQWYKEQVNKVTDDLTNDVKTMLFIHIPLMEQRNLIYVDLNNLPEGWTTETAGEGWSYVDGVIAKNHNGDIVGKNAVKDGWKVAKGCANFEGICSSDYNNGMYNLMLSLREGVNALFCGHDHTNDSVLYEEAGVGETPIYLAYGLCGGYATYNLYKNNKSDDPSKLKKGYSVITVHADCTFDYAGVLYDNGYGVTKFVENSLPYQG